MLFLLFKGLGFLEEELEVMISRISSIMLDLGLVIKSFYLFSYIKF